MSNISSNSFLSDLSKAFLKGFQSAFSIASTFLNDGTVLPIYYEITTSLPPNHPNPLLIMSFNGGYDKYQLALKGEEGVCVYTGLCLNGCLATMLLRLTLVCVCFVPARSHASQFLTTSTKTQVSEFGPPSPKSLYTPP